MIGLTRSQVTAMVAAMAASIVVLGAAPASADPAAPSNYESSVLLVDPLPTGVTFEVVGGDSFLVVTAQPGHEVLIPGYFSEPYVRIDADGSVWVNENSQAYYINVDRYANAKVPEGIERDSEPKWKQVADGGSYPWHDHRVHWMSPNPPPSVDGDFREVVFPWELPVIVDGQETVIRGELVWVPSVNPVAPLLAGLFALLPLLAWRRWRTPVAAALAAAAAMLAVIITLVQNTGTPAPARGFPVWVVFPALALLAAAAAFFAWNRGRIALAGRLNVAGGVILVAWAVATFEVLWLPVLPSASSAQVERVAVAFVWWAGVGVAAFSAMKLLARPRAGTA